MWCWVGEVAGSDDKDKLVDHEGRDVLVPIGSWDCSPNHPYSHGIRVSKENKKIIAAAPELLHHLKSVVSTYHRGDLTPLARAAEFLSEFDQ